MTYTDDVFRNLIAVAHANAVIRQRRGIRRSERVVSPDLARRIQLCRDTWKPERKIA